MRNIKRPKHRMPRTKWKVPEYCSNPDCGAKHSIKEMLLPGMQLIRDEETHYKVNKYRCVECEMTFQSSAQATEGVKIAVSVYQKKHGLLTAECIKSKRKALGIESAEKLAEHLDGVVSEATLKRIESGVHVQDPSTNAALAAKLIELEGELGYIAIDGLSDFIITVCSKNRVLGYQSTHDDWTKPFAGLYAELESGKTTSFDETLTIC